jgi:hypothetical protein
MNSFDRDYRISVVISFIMIALVMAWANISTINEREAIKQDYITSRSLPLEHADQMSVTEIIDYVNVNKPELINDVIENLKTPMDATNWKSTLAVLSGLLVMPAVFIPHYIRLHRFEKSTCVCGHLGTEHYLYMRSCKHEHDWGNTKCDCLRFRERKKVSTDNLR